MPSKQAAASRSGHDMLYVDVHPDEEKITLHGDLVGNNQTKISLSQGLVQAKKAAKARWFIDAHDLRLDEPGVEAWSEYVHLLLMDAELTYLPSQLGIMLCFDGGVVYKHGHSRFEGV